MIFPETVPDSASRSRVGGLRQRQLRRDRGGDLAAPQGREDLGEVGGQPGAEAVLVQLLAGPDVEEGGAAAVGQSGPQHGAEHDLQDRPLLPAAGVAGRGAAVGDEGAAGGEQVPGVDDAAAADVVEDRVHAARGQFADLLGHIAGAVVDRDDAGGAQGVVVAGRGGADDRHPGGQRELGQDRADAAAGAVHQDRLAGLHPRLAVQHLPGGDAVDHDGLGLLGAQALGDLDRVPGVDEHMAGPAADLGQHRDPPPEPGRGPRRRRRRSTRPTTS